MGTPVDVETETFRIMDNDHMYVSISVLLAHMGWELRNNKSTHNIGVYLGGGPDRDSNPGPCMWLLVKHLSGLKPLDKVTMYWTKVTNKVTYSH